MSSAGSIRHKSFWKFQYGSFFVKNTFGEGGSASAGHEVSAESCGKQNACAAEKQKHA